MSATSLGARDPRLADPAWMARMYVQQGDMGIAIEVGVDRKTVKRWREVHGIVSQPPGRRRGVTMTAPTPERRALHPADVVYERECRQRGLALNEDLLVARIRALHDAKLAGDDAAYDDALRHISSAAKLIDDQRQKARVT